MPEQYTKKLNISLTEAHYKWLKESADKERRSLASYVSYFLEKNLNDLNRLHGNVK